LSQKNAKSNVLLCGESACKGVGVRGPKSLRSSTFLTSQRWGRVGKSTHVLEDHCTVSIWWMKEVNKENKNQKSKRKRHIGGLRLPDISWNPCSGSPTKKDCVTKNFLNITTIYLTPHSFKKCSKAWWHTLAIPAFGSGGRRIASSRSSWAT
jgi:hypothetical protein